MERYADTEKKSELIPDEESTTAGARLAEEALDASSKTPRFYGLDIGLLKLGYTDDGSLNFGVNVGIARVDTKLGLENRIDAGVGVESIGAAAGVGVGINAKGLHADVSAGGNVANLAGARARTDARLGQLSGFGGELDANVGSVLAGTGAGAYISQRGLIAGYEARTGVEGMIGGSSSAHLWLNDNSSLGADIGANLGSASVGTGFSVRTEGNRLLRPGIHIDAGGADGQIRLESAAQVGPKLDAKVSVGFEKTNSFSELEGSGEWGLGFGQSGAGFQETRFEHNYSDGATKFAALDDQTAESQQGQSRADDRQATAVPEPVQTELVQTEPVQPIGKDVLSDNSPAAQAEIELNKRAEHRVVERGDTLWAIAKQKIQDEGRTSANDREILREINQLIVLNGLQHHKHIFPGQILHLYKELK